MSKRGGHRMHPITQMVMALNAAAHNIENDYLRALAARDVDRIPMSRLERYRRGLRGQTAVLARGLLSSLGDVQPKDFAGTAKLLRDYASVIESHGVIVSETWLGARRRHREGART